VGSPAATGSFDPVDFGADPTGVADSAPAFEALWAAVGEARNVLLSIPAGRFRLSRQVALEGRGNAENYGLHIQGAGEDATELWVDNAQGGLRFAGAAVSRMTVTVSGLSLVALREPAGTALEFDTANPGDQHSRQFTARDVLIRGERFDSGSFARGLVVRNAWYPLLDNVKVTALYGPATERDCLESALLLEDCYSPLIQGCYVWGSRDALVCRAVAGQPEDGIVRDCYFVGCVRGVVVESTHGASAWEEPAFRVQGCHVAYRDCGVRFFGVRQAFISQCLFYCSDRRGAAFFGGGEPRDFDPLDVDLAYASDVLVTDNHFTEPANPRRVAVRIGPDSGNITVRGNQFNLEGTGIRNESPLPSTAADNTFGGRRDFSGGLRKYDDRTGSLLVRDAD
jgi:hypothetical protein